MNIHYNPITGEILAFDTNDLHNAPSQAIPGCAICNLSGTFQHIDTSKQRIEDGQLVDKTSSEIVFYHLPSELEVKSLRNSELYMTDWVNGASHLDEGTMQKWKEYRQALRDLGEISNPVDMVAAWPKRPDGTDVAYSLRART